MFVHWLVINKGRHFDYSNSGALLTHNDNKSSDSQSINTDYNLGSYSVGLQVQYWGHKTRIHLRQQDRKDHWLMWRLLVWIVFIPKQFDQHQIKHNRNRGCFSVKRIPLQQGTDCTATRLHSVWQRTAVYRECSYDTCSITSTSFCSDPLATNKGRL